MNQTQQNYIQAQEIEQEVRRQVVNKLNPPVFEYEPIEQPFCPHWLRGMEHSGRIITWREVVSIVAIAAIIGLAYVYSNELQEVLR